jgi:hypothetical protein
MPQEVPAFEWSADALTLRAFVYEYWCERGVGPNLRQVHEATGLDRRAIIQAYKQLQLGVACVVDQDSQNCNVLKFQPFSSYPSQVELWLEDRFHTYVGCAMEAVAVSKMPPFIGRDLRLETYCSCCLAPISIIARDGLWTSVDPATTRIHISLSPWDWGNVDIQAQCDAMNFVIDDAHAARYERIVSRRGALLTFEQARVLTDSTAEQRMHDAHWPPVTMAPKFIISALKHAGVDVSMWSGEREPVPGT